MNVNVIKLEDGGVEIDGVKYVLTESKTLSDAKAWCKKNSDTTLDPVALLENGDVFISFTLPCANSDWTWNVFDSMKQCEEHFNGKGYSSYPRHQMGWMDNDKLYMFIGGNI